MARGLYYQTGVGRNDMVLHQDHRGRWRIDLVTSAGGNHIDVTGREGGAGPNQGYSTAELAFGGALDEQRRRGLRGKTHVWIQRGDGYESYMPEGDYLPNRNGSLYDELLAAGHQLDHHESDLYVRDTPEARAIIERHGQKYNRFTDNIDRLSWLEVWGAYDPFWQSKQRPNGPRTGILSDGTRVNVYHQPGGLDEYTIVPHGADWDAMERRGMRSMLGTSKTGAGYSQWQEGQEGRHLGRKVAWVEVPDELKRHIERRIVQESSMVANPRKRRAAAPKTETREERLARQWDEAEESGLVRLISEPEYENYFDVYGEPDDPEERAELERLIERDGLWMWASQYKSQDTGEWVTADSIGMIFGNDLHAYEWDLKEAALNNVFGGYAPNARGTVVDEHTKRELELYIENEYALIGDPKSMGKSIDANLRKKVAKGTYDPARAPQAWQYLIDEGAKRYAKAFSSSERDATQIFNAATRRAVAADFARAWEAENLHQ